MWGVARALADRSVKLEHFEGDAPLDPAIRDLLGRVEARPHPEMPADSPLQWGSEVVVHTVSGQRLASRIDDYPSRGPAGVWMTQDELWTKFADCAGRALPHAQVAPLFETLLRIETLGDMAEVTRLLETSARQVKAA